MTLRMFGVLSQLAVEFFWGEATWGMTRALRQIRWIKLISTVIGIAAASMVLWAVIGYHAAIATAAGNDTFSYYEGKVLEERVTELQRKINDNNATIRQMLADSNTQTLLAVRMQNQIDQMQNLLDAGIKVLGGVVAAVVASLLRDLVQIKLRRERATLGHRREND